MGVHTSENGNLSRSKSISMVGCSWLPLRGMPTEITVESVGDAGDDEDICCFTLESLRRSLGHL